MKCLSMESFYNGDFDCSKMKQWFSSFKRFQQMKRFFKVCDPALEEENKGDKMYKVRELWMSFIDACKANYWPDREISIDEAMKKFKGRCSFKQYIRTKPVRWGLKVYFVYAVPPPNTFGMPASILEKDQKKVKKIRKTKSAQLMLQFSIFFVLYPTRIILSTWIIITPPFLCFWSLMTWG